MGSRRPAARGYRSSTTSSCVSDVAHSFEGSRVVEGVAAKVSASEPLERGSSSSSSVAGAPEQSQIIVLEAVGHTATVARPLAAAISRRQVQVDGVRWLYAVYHGGHREGCFGGILGDGMGVGKTLQAIALINTLVAAGQAGAILILTPKAVLRQWAREFDKFLSPAGGEAAQPPLEILCVSDTAQRATAQRALARLRGGAGVVALMTYTTAALQLPEFTLNDGGVDLLVADEAHALRTAGTDRYDAVARLKARARVLLTATPVQNNLTELHSLVSLAVPGALRDGAWFREYIEAPIEAARADVVGLEEALAGELAAVELEQLLAPLLLARELAANCKLPAAVYTVPLRPSPLQRELYALLLAGAAELGEGLAVTRLQALKLLLLHPRLLCARSSMAYLLGPHVPRSWPACPRAMLMLSSKTRALVLLLEHVVEHSSEGVVVVSSSVVLLETLIEPYLAQLEGVGRDGYVSITGKRKGVRSAELFNARDSGVRVLLLSLDKVRCTRTTAHVRICRRCTSHASRLTRAALRRRRRGST